MEAEKAAVLGGAEAGMEDKVKVMIELNAIREKCSEQLFKDNPEKVNSFSVCMDNGQPAIEIGVDPEASADSLCLPSDLDGLNVIFRTVGRATSELPCIG